MIQFLVDVDEVLASFTDTVVPIVSGMLGREWNPREELPDDCWDLFSQLSPGQKDVVHAAMERPGFCLDLPIEPGAQDFIGGLRQFGCEVFAVTSPLKAPFWAHERELWLAKHFEIPKSHVLQVSSKHKVEGDFFLDDHPEHVTNWAKRYPRGEAMLWTTKFNRGRLKGPSDAYRIDGWAAVLKRVRAFGERSA